MRVPIREYFEKHPRLDEEGMLGNTRVIQKSRSKIPYDTTWVQLGGFTI